MGKKKNTILNMTIFAALALALTASLRPAIIANPTELLLDSSDTGRRSIISTMEPTGEPFEEDDEKGSELDSPSPEPEESPEPSNEPEEITNEPALPEAVELTDTLTLSFATEVESAREYLLDGEYNTKLYFEGGTTIVIGAAEEIHSLYLVWDSPPGEWFIGGNENTQLCGENGYIHEYVSLIEAGTEVTIQISQDGSTLCDIYAFAAGSPPRSVQRWSAALDEADMLLLPTHGKDEHLYFVGILPYYAGELGYRVQVAYMVDHSDESGRYHEMLDGLWTVGVTSYPINGIFPDYEAESIDDARAFYGENSFIEYQVTLLRRFKPKVVVGHDLNGEYGNGAHMLNAHALQTAVISAADSSYHIPSFEQHGIWDTPKLYLHLYWENTISMNWDIPLSRFDGATAADMAVEAYECFQSQQDKYFAVPRIGPSGQVFGLAKSTVGEDAIGGNMFENIPMQQ